MLPNSSLLPNRTLKRTEKRYPKSPDISLFGSKTSQKQEQKSTQKDVKPKEIKVKGAPGTLEKEFLEGFHKGRVAVSCGTKNSGKSYTALHYLKWCFDNDVYETYFLCLPTYEHEANDSYAFIKEYKGKGKITVFTSWDQIVIDRIKALPPKVSKFCFVDDASGNFRLNATQDELTFIAQIRHFNCSLWLIFHMLRNALPTTYRCCVDYLFVYLNTNRKGLESCHEEFMSLVFPTFKEFLNYYKKEVLNREYNALLIFTREVGVYNAGVVDWNILKVDLKKK
jgi:hypothetical protein